jgi:hypothetical protein
VGGDGNTALGTEQPRGGTGGAGITHDFSGVSMPYAGGGGGGGGRFGGGGTGGSGHNVTGGSGGSGSQAGGGTGGAGKPNTGGGGGGGTENSPGNPGGSGIVMIRYPIPTLGAIFAAGGTITDLGNGYRLHTFLASANFEIIPPIIMGLAPDHGWQGQSIAITITGTDFSATSKVSVGAGAVGVSGIVVLDKTTLQCTLTIPPTLAPGPYPLIVTTEAGPSAPQSFTVNASGSGMFIVM